MLTLVTVNYRSAAATIGLLRSLEHQTDRAFDVIVVDNDSPADDRAALSSYAALSPLNLELIMSDDNRGFSGGNNVAIRKALAQGAEWILCINPDTRVGEDFIASLTRRLPAAHSLVGLPLAEGERTAFGGGVRWLSPTLAHIYEPNGRADNCIGAGMAVHRDVFERAGLLDERFFLYFEDAEFSLRARAAGFPVAFLDGPVIAHAVSATTKSLGSPLLLRYHMRNALLFNRLHGPRWVRAALPFWAAFGMLKQGAKALFMPSRRPHAAAIAAGIMDFYRNRYGIIR